MQEIRLHDNHIQVYCYSYAVHRLYGIQSNKVWLRCLPLDLSL